MFYCQHIGCFFSFSSIHQLSRHRVNKGNHLMVEPGILLPLPAWFWFLHFLYKVVLHLYSGTLVRVNILSSWRPSPHNERLGSCELLVLWHHSAEDSGNERWNTCFSSVFSARCVQHRHGGLVVLRRPITKVTQGNQLVHLDAKIGCCSFTSLQHVRSYQDRYRLVTMGTHGDFTVLSQWEIRPPAPWPDVPLNHIILTLSHPVLVLSY